MLRKVEGQMPSLPGFSPLQTRCPKRGGGGRLTGIEYQCIIDQPIYPTLLQTRVGCGRLQNEAVSEALIKEVIAEVTILSALIIVPLAFLGPGWTRRKPDDRVVDARFREEHSASKANEQDPESD
jgi:hypothetical protein